MTGEEMLQKMSELLSFHVRLGCSVHEVGYKDDYFRLFLDAYRDTDTVMDEHNVPGLTGHAIRDALGTKWAREASPYNDRRLALLNALLPMWDEWHYALNKVSYGR